jgi:hypothetical protein
MGRLSRIFPFHFGLFAGMESTNLELQALHTRVTIWVCEKIAQNVAQRIFVKINTLLLLWKKVAKNFGLFL